MTQFWWGLDVGQVLNQSLTNTELTEEITLVSGSLIGLDLTGLEDTEEGGASVLVESFEVKSIGLSYADFPDRLGITNGSLEE